MVSFPRGWTPSPFARDTPTRPRTFTDRTPPRAMVNNVTPGRGASRVVGDRDLRGCGDLGGSGGVGVEAVRLRAPPIDPGEEDLRFFVVMDRRALPANAPPRRGAADEDGEP